VSLDLFHNVFLLNFAFEAAQRTLECFAVLQMDFCQLKLHHLPVTPDYTRAVGPIELLYRAYSAIALAAVRTSVRRCHANSRARS
jgi:hypothetical protein